MEGMLTLLATVALQQARTPSLTGHIETLTHSSKALGNSRKVLVYLPPNYASEPKRRYPVLYLHDGQNVFDGATSYIPNQEWKCDEAAESLISAGLIEPIIMVAIENAGVERGNEYLWKRMKFRDQEMGGKGDLYAKLVIDEVKPMIDQKFRSNPKESALCGSSLGGNITYHLGFKHPGVFKRLAIVSPAVWCNDRLMIDEVKALNAKLPLRIWLDMGTKEGAQGLNDARAFRDALVGKGWALGKDLAYYEDGFAEHNEAAWARRFPAMLLWMFGK